ncbi:hypothetical protein Tco_1043171 [Tanacetum coccineum]|uniref:Uncharacterized protein n=1 Tax=Tanacetum coccineum TaxID=301880 RepID=A0ABQ5GLF6_9ASTR
MINKCLTGKATAYDHPRLPMLSFIWGILTGNNVDFELILEDFKYQIESRKTSKQKKLQSDQHVIKLDATLGNLKFANKGVKDPVFGIAIPTMTLNDDIKASTEYLAKSKGSKPVKATGKGKGLLSKEGIKVVVERAADYVDPEETEHDEEEPLARRRPTGVVIGVEARRESDEEGVEHSKKLKGIEMLFEAAQFKLDLKKARRASKNVFIFQQHPRCSGEGSGVIPEVPDELTLKSSNEGADVNPEVPDEPSDSSSSSSYDFEEAVKDISSDEADDTKKANDVKKADIEKDIEEQVAEEQA